jgi:hypothetical protein
MEFIAEFFVSIVLEFLLQIISQASLELGWHSLGAPFLQREKRNPVLAAIGYCLLGFIFGLLSLLVFPRTLVRGERFYNLDLLIAPVLAGLTMSAVGRLRERQGKTVLRLDSFVYGFIFAFTMASIRFVYAS